LKTENFESEENMRDSPSKERSKNRFKAAAEEKLLKHSEYNHQERKISLELISDESTLRQFLFMKSSRIWQEVQNSPDNRIKIKYL